MILNSIALGIALAMDAFSVSVANGLSESDMSQSKTLKISGTFAFFQWLMPLLGWLCVHYIVNTFKAIDPYIPWIALILLCFLGIKMIIEGFKDEESEPVSDNTLFVQGIATSIDALSVGFAIVSYTFLEALLSAIIIGVVTFIICLIGLKIGKTFGSKLTSKATILGGIILILIGIKIFIG